MKNNKIIISILAAIIVILVLVMAFNKKGADEDMVDPNATTTMNSTTTPGTNTVVTKTVYVNQPATAGTGNTAAVDVFPKQFILSMGQSFSLADGTVITLKTVTESRCPTDENITCVWAGNVAAKMNIKKGVATKDFELTYPGPTTTYVYNAYKISFDGVTPDKGLQSNPAPQKDYKLTFTVIK